jgi:hypothetical protein
VAGGRPANRGEERYREDIEELREILKKKGLTDRQVEVGIKYYVNFASKFDIPPARAADMIVRMIENMRRAFEKDLEER